MRRKLFIPLIVFAIVAAFFGSCQKDAIIPEQKMAAPEAVATMDEAYEKADMYNDTLKQCSHSHSMMNHAQHVTLLAHCDEMFHHYDSVFTAMHHNHCQNENVNCCSNDSMNMNGMMGGMMDDSNPDTTNGSGGMSGNNGMNGNSGSMGNSGSGNAMNGGMMGGHMMHGNRMSGCMHMDCSGHMAAMDSLGNLHQQ